MRRIGDYELLDELGAGGMGTVFRARRGDEEVALKLLPAWADAEALARFEVELTATRRLEHPAIVPVLDAGRGPKGQPYIVLALIEGQSLEQRLRQGPLDADDAAAVIGQVAAGLAHAHARGVLHRDLKPANVLLDRAGAAHLTDFGLARLADGLSLTQTSELLGTPCYMAPEQVDPTRGPVDARSDVYGLGATLYELLTGRRPFGDAGGLAQIFQAVTSAPLIRPTRLRPDLDPELESICLRCMERDPTRRYPSAEAVVAALAGLERRAPDSALPPRWALAGAALLVAALLGALLGGASSPVQPRPAASPRQAGASSPTPEAKPSSAARFAIAKRLYNSGDHVGAEAILSALVELPDAPQESHRALALCLAALKRPAEARRALRRGLERDPRDARAWAVRSDFASKDQRYAEAIDYATRSLEIEPNADAHVNRGVAHFHCGRLEDALADFGQALALQPDHYNAAINEIVALQRLRRHEAGLVQARELIERNPEAGEPRLYEAQFLHALGRVDEFEASLVAAGERGEVDALRALVPLRRRRDPAGARAAADQALELRPGDASLWLLRASLGGPQAIGDLDRALELDPKLPRAHQLRALFRLQAGDASGALVDIDQALRRDPDGADVQALRARILRALGAEDGG